MPQLSIPHGLAGNPLPRKPRLKVVIIGVIFVGVTAALPSDTVGAVAQAVGTAAATAAVLLESKKPREARS